MHCLRSAGHVARRRVGNPAGDGDEWDTHLSRVQVGHGPRHVRRERQAESPWEGMGGEDELSQIPTGHKFGYDTDQAVSTCVLTTMTKQADYIRGAAVVELNSQDPPILVGRSRQS